MMKLAKKIGALSAIGCALLASQVARADEPFVNSDWANSAWYIGGGIGVSRANIDQDHISRSLSANGSTVTAFTRDEKDALTHKFFVGKQLNRYLALEAGYFDLGEFRFNATTSDGSLRGRTAMRGVNLDLLGQWPLTERLSVLGRVGMNYAKTNTRFTGNRLNAVTGPDASEKKLNAKAGLGMEYKLSEALALRAEVERYRVNDAIGNRGDVDMVTVGLTYKMGRAAAAAPRYVAPPEPAVAPVVVEPAPTPAPAPVPVSEKVSFAAEALFDFDKAVVKPEGAVALDDLLAKLQGMNTEVMVTVGHTDSVGTHAYNEKLSLRRADAVKRYLVSKGLDASRIYTEGKGETQAMADNTTAEGRARNRRVTVEVVGTRSVAK